MTFFTIEEFNNKYNITIEEEWKIEKACEMIYSQIGVRYRNPNWDTVSLTNYVEYIGLCNGRKYYVWGKGCRDKWDN